MPWLQMRLVVLVMGEHLADFAVEARRERQLVLNSPLLAVTLALALSRGVLHGSSGEGRRRVRAVVVGE